MHDTETIDTVAIAAHLHVLLRRKTGRVTDTEWMACNAEYAQEIVRFARERARLEHLPELADWAQRLEQALRQTQAAPIVQQPLLHRAEPDMAAPAPIAPRYVGGIR
ncbi:MAG: hypothetical protein PHX60_12515 [Giesbergeria sp.]|uniref:hypothetical protein n=1 Tax=Giesbergeria sp. TaxID=2818473 RepID=UPI002624E993|nr:hypothetical protein [Giesbergeria sp.]MDD2610484.1 hypothetical protein [Giesbergeria sp.]